MVRATMRLNKLKTVYAFFIIVLGGVLLSTMMIGHFSRQEAEIIMLVTTALIAYVGRLSKSVK